MRHVLVKNNAFILYYYTLYIHTRVTLKKVLGGEKSCTNRNYSSIEIQKYQTVSETIHGRFKHLNA